MDRLIYVAMTGAKHTLEQQASVANNLANLSTNGFRAQLNEFRAVPVIGPTQPTRAFVVDSTTGADLRPGAYQHTGRDMDVAVQGDGWLAVEPTAGGEAYTRDGSLQTNAEGVLQTRNGLNVLGESGTISVPPGSQVMIGRDGIVSALLPGQPPTEVGRLKLVNPPAADLKRGDDGLFRTRNNQPAEADASVTVAPATLETSNVNAAEAMVNMISLARQFDMQMKMISTADADAKQASQLFSMT